MGRRILFVDASAGVSGDMLAAGLIDLGFPLSALRQIVRCLGWRGIRLKLKRLDRNGVRPCQLFVEGGGRLPAQPAGWVRILQKSDLPSGIRRSALRVLRVLVDAEARAHRLPRQGVHFHQLRSADSWVSILGFCAGLEYLRVEKLHCSPIPLGLSYLDHHGKRRAASGPAAKEMLTRFDTSLRRDPFEWTTPTGAALLSALASPEPAPSFKLLQVGHAAGHRIPPSGPRVMRLLWGHKI